MILDFHICICISISSVWICRARYGRSCRWWCENYSACWLPGTAACRH